MPIVVFLLSPLGRAVLIAASLTCTFAAGYLKGYGAADRATLEASLEQARKDQAAAARIANEAAARERAAEAQRAALQAELDSYADDLKARPDSRCALGPADIKRLRDLADPTDAPAGSSRIR